MLLSIENDLKLPEGLILRPPTMADLETAVDLFNACSMALIGASSITLNALETEWQSPKFDVTTAARVVETADGQLVGYVEVWDTDHVPVTPWVWGRVHPDWEGKEIGKVLMDWAEERARQPVTRCPDDARVAYLSSTLSSNKPAIRLFEHMDMKLVRHFWRMVIDLDTAPPQPVWPQGLTITTFAEYGNLEPIFLAIEDSFKDHWGHVDQPAEEGFAEWQHWVDNDEEHDPSLWFLALDGDEIAGFSLCRRRANDDADMGWVSTLGVRRPWRRQGLALALLHHSFSKLYQRGKKSVGLGVDASSITGATRLYEKAGMYVSRQFNTYEKELRPGRRLNRE